MWPLRRTLLTNVAALGYAAQAQQFFDRLADQPTAQRKNDYATLIDALVVAGVWAKLDALYVFAAADQATALVNLKSSSFAATLTNAPTFAADRGFTTNGTNNFINTNYNPSTAGGSFALNSGVFGIWNRLEGQTVGAAGTEGTDVAATIASPRNGTDQATFKINQSANIAFSPNTNSLGLFVASRLAADSVKGYINGAEVASGSNASEAPANANLTLGKRSVSFASREFAAALVGAGLSDAEHLALYTALNSYMTAVGAA